jgi:DNA-binding beta-propeller fold protein YncE
LRRLQEQFPNELVVIGVHSAKFTSEKLTQNIQAAVLRHGIEHPVVNDAGFQIWDAYAVRAWPTVVLIDPAGKVAEVQSGEIQAEQWVPVIQRLIHQAEQEGIFDPKPLEFHPASENQPARLLNFPSKLTVLPGGRLFVADTGNNRILELKLAEDGLHAALLRAFGSTQAGLQDGPAENARFHSPRGMSAIQNSLYVADTDNYAIRKIELDSGEVQTVAGTGEKGHTLFPQNRPPTQTPLRSPWDVLGLEQAGDEVQGILFIAMAGSHQIWILIDERRIGVFAGNGREALVDGPLQQASFNQPSGLALGMGHLLVADAEASAIRAISLGDEPKVFTLVGQGLFEFGDVDGIGPEVRLQHPLGIAFANGLIYIADSYNHKIKTLDPTTGQVQTLAGTGQPGSADGAFGQAQFYEPEGLAFYQNRLYIADTNNHLIRVIDLQANTVETLVIRGLENLSQAVAQTGAQRQLAVLDLAPGNDRIAFHFQLPQGYHLNEEAPISLVSETGSYTFTPGEPVDLPIRVEKDREIPVDLTLYYCENQDARLCMIHDERLILPVRVASSAPSQAEIQLEVDLKKE